MLSLDYWLENIWPFSSCHHNVYTFEIIVNIVIHSGYISMTLHILLLYVCQIIQQGKRYEQSCEKSRNQYHSETSSSHFYYLIAQLLLQQGQRYKHSCKKSLIKMINISKSGFLSSCHSDRNYSDRNNRYILFVCVHLYMVGKGAGVSIIVKRW